MDRTHSFGYWLRRRRKALDLTQAELAQRASCSLDLIQKIEADARRPSRQMAETLADVLGIDASERAAFIQAARAERAVDQLELAAQPVEQPQGAPQSNLPTQLTTLIGREHEVATITGQLRRLNVRLVTLTGPGGIGKTRLSLQVASELFDDFAHGVYFVDLAPIREPDLVISQIATTLGVKEVGGQPLLATLKAYLCDKQMLLLLDNFEQVIDAAPLVSELLGGAPQLNVLVTSREVLHLRGEQEVGVEPLAVPDSANLPALDHLTQYAAVALFRERVQASQPRFQVTNANGPAVAEICARLDGLPLAIELAAARLKLFSPEALLARLSSPLVLLRGGARDLPSRQQTIRNTITWSYDLLSEAEQTLFWRLGVFVGGWTLEAAQTVTTLNVQTLERSDLLDELAALVDKSLVRHVAGPGDAPRFVMLETLREYALERLQASGEAEIVRQQHAIYYLRLSAVGKPDRGDNEEAWLGRVDCEYDNLWSALSWSQTAAGNSELALRLVDVLTTLCHHRGIRGKAIAALERALNHPLGVGRTTAHAVARDILALHLGLIGDYRTARMQYEQALLLWRELGDTPKYAGTLERLGWLAREQGDSASAWSRMIESLAISRELGDIRGVAGILVSMAGIAIEEEDPARAETLLAECRAMEQEGGVDRSTSFWILNHLGHAAQLRGAYARAAQLHKQSLGLIQTPGAAYGAGVLSAYRDLGETALGLRRLDEAARWLTQGLAASRMLSEQPSQAWYLAGLGSVAALNEEPERAARLWGAAERLRQSIGCRPAPATRATYAHAMELARTQLGEEAFAAAWAAGQALTLEQVIAEALGGDD